MNLIQISKAISALLNAPSAEEAHRLLRAHPWLTSRDVHLKLTQVIANKCQARDLPSIAVFTACRGLLYRCRSDGIEQALGAQPGWPLATQGPLLQLLALDETDSPDMRIKFSNAALRDVDPETEPDLYGWLRYNLGLGYQAQADAGAKEALKVAAEHFEAAVQVWDRQGPWLGQQFGVRAQHNLGRLYLEHRHGDLSHNVETALHWLERARTSSAEDSAERVDASILTGNAYLDRIRGERLENVERGISYYEEAHRLAQEHHLPQKREHENRLGEIEHNLAVAYRVRLRGRRADNYEQARAWAESARSRFDRHASPQDWARTTAELAAIYAHRREGDRDDNLERAIDYAEQALDFYDPDAHPRQWTLVQLNLGNLYCDRVSGVRRANEQQAISCFQAVLDQSDPKIDPLRWANAMNNLGTVYAGRSTRPSDKSYREATKCFSQALEIRQPGTLPSEARQTTTNWGNLAFRFGEWAEAWQAFHIALEAHETLYKVSSTEAGRQAELVEGAGLATKSAFCLLKLHQPVQAVEVLEHGRTRIVGDILARDRAILEGIDPAQRQAFERARQRVRELEAEGRRTDDEDSRDFLEISTDLSAAYATLADIVERIRATTPGFMPAELNIAAIGAIADPESPLVYLLTTEHGSAAVIVPYRPLDDGRSRADEDGLDERHVVWLNDFCSSELNDLLAKHDETGNLRGGLLHGQVSTGEITEELDTALPFIRERLMSDLVERLDDLGHTAATLIPVGRLSLLPLHAAVLDELTGSFGPSAQVLGQAQDTAALDVLIEHLTLVGVGNPFPNGSPLPYAKSELQAIVNLWPGPCQPLYEEQATLERTKAELPAAGVCHFACHGKLNLDNPLASGLHLGDGRLRLTDLLDKDEVDLKKARLAVLSACRTAITDFRELPDEAIGLPAGFLVAGVPGVVGTLWPVSDVSTSLLMFRFYQEWLENGATSSDLSQALRRAQIWLRDITASELADFFKCERTAILTGDPAIWPAEPISQLYRRFRDLEADKQPYAHPIHWAAFTYTGGDNRAVRNDDPSPGACRGVASVRAGALEAVSDQVPG